MQEIILENLFKWVQTLDFSFSRKGENYIFICEELNININAISQEEFYAAFTNQLLLGIEKLFNLKVLGIDLKELFGIKKEETKKEKVKSKEAKPSAKTEEKPQDLENWIKQELNRAFENGELDKQPTKTQYLQEFWRNQKHLFPDYTQEYPRFPWNEVICLVSK